MPYMEVRVRLPPYHSSKMSFKSADSLSLNSGVMWVMAVGATCYIHTYIGEVISISYKLRQGTWFMQGPMAPSSCSIFCFSAKYHAFNQVYVSAGSRRCSNLDKYKHINVY